MNNEAKVGIIVIVALTIFTITFLSVATMQFGGDKVEYHAFFKFAGGLDPGKQVRFGGRKAGIITEVRPAPDDPTMAEVIVEVRQDIPVNIESVATIGSLSALGDNYLEITPGSKGAALLPPGGEIQSRESLTFADITAKIGEVADTADTLMIELQDKIVHITDDLHAVLSNVETLTGEKNQKSVEELLSNANHMIETQSPKIDQITDQVTGLLDHFDDVVNDMREVAKTADKAITNVDGTVTELRDPLKKDLAEIERTVVEARETIEEIRALVVLNGINIQDTVENFRIVSEDLRQFADEIKQRPYSLLRTKAKPDREVPVAGEKR